MTSLLRRACVTVAAAVGLTMALAGCAAGAVFTSGDPVGRWGSAVEGEPGLQIHADGTMGGHDGCNGFGGRWERDGDTIVFRDTMMTLVACPGHTGPSLAGLDTAVIAGGVLHLQGADGDVIAVLPRVPAALTPG